LADVEDTFGELVYIIILVIITLGPLVAVGIIFAKHRLHATVAILLIAFFWVLIIVIQLRAAEALTDFNPGVVTSAAVGMLMLLPVILLSVAPAKAVSRRLIFLALGLLLLIALNELSKLGLDVTVPKLQG
jgi:predicted secreted protein